MSYQILIIEDDEPTQLIISAFLSDSDYVVTFAQSAQEAFDLLEGQPFDLALVDLGLPDNRGTGIVAKVSQACPAMEIIIMTVEDDPAIVRQSTEYGARDYITKPLSRERLRTSIQNVLNYKNLYKTVQDYQQIYSRDQFFDLVGKSTAMQGVFRTIEFMAQNMLPVLMTGPQGTEKEAAARALHASGPYHDGPFAVVCCDMDGGRDLKKHLFGDKGVIANCDGGTCLIQDIELMSLQLQKRLYRFLQTGSLKKDAVDAPLNVKIVVTSQFEPRDLLDRRQVYPQLMNFIRMVHVEIPALRFRLEDIPLLAEKFLEQANKTHNKEFVRFTDECMERLMERDWPENVMGLSAVIDYAVSCHDGETIQTYMLDSPNVNTPQLAEISSETYMNQIENILFGHNRPDLIVPLKELERLAVDHALKCCKGNVKEASRRLEVSQATLYRKRV